MQDGFYDFVVRTIKLWAKREVERRGEGQTVSADNIAEDCEVLERIVSHWNKHRRVNTGAEN